MQRELERLRTLYSRMNITEGVSGEEIIKCPKEQGAGGVTLPTLPATIDLTDSYRGIRSLVVVFPITLVKEMKYSDSLASITHRVVKAPVSKPGVEVPALRNLISLVGYVDPRYCKEAYE